MRNLRRASVSNPQTWSSYEQAASTPDVDGVGFVLTADDPYCAVDLDHCVIGAAGVHPRAGEIVDELDSYTEISSSGSGLHVIVRADLPATCRHKAPAPWGGSIEIYDRSRFIAMTGNVLGAHTEIRGAQKEIDAIRERLLPERDPATIPTRQHPVTRDDQETLRRMFASRNGTAIKLVWDGDSSAYRGDRSGRRHLWSGDHPEGDRRLVIPPCVQMPLSLPFEMRSMPQWVCWRKREKIPLIPLRRAG